MRKIFITNQYAGNNPAQLRIRSDIMNTKRVFIFVFISFLIVQVSHAKDAYKDKDLDIRFPETVASLRFLDKLDLKKPGLGYDVRYQDEALFIKVDIYVYDRTYEDIGSGISSERVKVEFNSILTVFPYFERMGYYKALKEVMRGQKHYRGSSVIFLWVRHQYRQILGKGVQYSGERISDTFLSAKGGKFLKVRMTLKKEQLEEREKDIEEFMKQLAKLIEGS